MAPVGRDNLSRFNAVRVLHVGACVFVCVRNGECLRASVLCTSQMSSVRPKRAINQTRKRFGFFFLYVRIYFPSEMYYIITSSRI